MKYDWLYVAKRQDETEFIKAFESFDPKRVEWTTNVNEAAEFTENEWEHEGDAIDFILGKIPCDHLEKGERLCLVSYSDQPRRPGERPSRRYNRRHYLRLVVELPKLVGRDGIPMITRNESD
jgi:hypothetical protein